MGEIKPFWQSLGVVGPIATVIVWAVNKKWPGAGLTSEDVSQFIDQFMILLTTVLAVWGRVRATKEVVL